MRLAVSVVGSRDNFVLLPPSVVQSLYDAPQPASTLVLRLQWPAAAAADGGATHTTAFVSWAGGASAGEGVLAVPAELARGCELGEGQAVDAVALQAEEAPAATQVFVAPATADDWEVVELHREALELMLLNQVNVASAGAAFAVWPGASDACARLRVRRTVPEAACVRLVRDVTEVVVAPLERAAPRAAAERAPTLRRRGARAWLRAAPAPRSTALHAARARVSAGAMRELGIADGALCELRASGRRGCGQRRLQDAGRRRQPTSARTFALAFADAGCPAGVLSLTRAQRRQMAAASLTRVQICRIESDEPAVAERTLTVRQVTWGRRNPRPLPPQSVRNAFLSWLAAPSEAVLVPVTHGSIVTLAADGQELDVILTFGTWRSEGADPEAPAAVDTPSAGGIHWLARGGDEAPIVEVGSLLELAGNDDEHSRPRSDALVGVADERDAIRSFVRAVLFGTQVRAQLSLPPPGGLLVHGMSGVGKSALVSSVAREFQSNIRSLVYTVTLDANDFVGAKASVVKAVWTNAWQDATDHSPAILVLDNLDKLMAADTGEDSASAENSSRGQFIAELMFSQQATSMSSTKPVVLIACCSRQDSLSPSLRQPGTFDQEMVLQLPSATSRAELLHKLLLDRNCALASSSIAEQVVSATESFSFNDLQRVVERAVHAASAAKPSKADAASGRLSIAQRNFDQALANFTPASLAGVSLVKKNGSSWHTIGGMSDAHSILLDTFAFATKYPQLSSAAPIRLKSGALLYGPPGCGKTLLGSAIAAESGMNLISVKGPELLNKYIGASEQAVRQKFADARAAAPCIIFLDEFESIAPCRGADSTGVTDRVVNALLTELDGVEECRGVYTLAATSRPDLIDAALLRPGRLDTLIHCDLPDENDRRAILEVASAGLNLDQVEWGGVAAATEGFTGADLHAVLGNAQLKSIHASTEAAGGDAMSMKVTQAMVEEALKESRPSVSASERSRLGAIYGQFTSGAGPRKPATKATFR